MKKFLSVLFAVFFAISLFFTFAISVVRFNVRRSAVKDFLCNFVQYSIDLSEIKVEPEFAQELIASEEVSEFMEKFGKDIYNSFTYTSSDINVTAKDVENLKEKVLALCEKYAKTSLSWMSDSYIMQDGLDNACRDYLLLQKTKLSCVCDRKL